MRLSMSEMTTYRWSLEEDLAAYKEAGFDGIGVWRQKLSDCGEEEGIDLLCESGLQVSSLTWIGGFTGSDGNSHKDSIDDGINALRLAAAMQAECVIAYTGARGGHTHKHADRLARTALAELTEVAFDLDVTLAIEPMHHGCAEGWTFLTELDNTLELIHSVKGGGRGGVQLVFDTYQLAHDAALLARLPEIVPHIALVHLGDARRPPCGEQDRCCLGEGIIPLADIVARLHQLNYQGFYEVELMGEEIEAVDYHRLLHDSRRTFSALVGVS